MAQNDTLKRSNELLGYMVNNLMKEAAETAGFRKHHAIVEAEVLTLRAENAELRKAINDMGKQRP